MSPSNLGYVVLGVSDLARWESFAVDAIGMQAGSRMPGSLALRMDAQAQRLVLEQGEQDDLLAAGWDLESPAALEAYVQGLRARGLPLEQASDAQAARRRVQALYAFRDPQGWQHEFYWGAQVADAPFQSAQLRGPGFLTGALGFGHLLTKVHNVAEGLALYQDALGLRLSDTIREEVRPGVVVDATFLHAATGRHHSLAIAALPGPKQLSHLMVEVLDVDDVGLAYDRCIRLGHRIHMGLGRHPNDRCFSFYVQTPSDFSLEVGHGSVWIDDGVWKPGHYHKLSEWGHQRTPPAVSA